MGKSPPIVNKSSGLGSLSPSVIGEATGSLAEMQCQRNPQEVCHLCHKSSVAVAVIFPDVSLRSQDHFSQSARKELQCFTGFHCKALNGLVRSLGISAKRKSF